ncbi:N(6)-L-threonylcarbamoyladenine synthase Kae1 [Candidatus Bathyarchaeota archaeon]|nr:N(6)-L-threonylcarbamoyladenine synthase Kae1 [Candidatus Bathyarchaeota archaeon]MBT7186019.1 N(6)-L-threonylcarbamoyladenine synthase Kae1 [Candidatus Bathyarchaeota archaeon]MBT7346651.1 N(6)-L-threonylcarbamoyladenine synthase Kae1 [Candidatus Bathyarchaeota archaeon]MBT7915254.1 N(6)-L-threonylcarbamoyladenine synthase Kae1 [Candidatus Bathyarchaeota archaeon]
MISLGVESTADNLGIGIVSSDKQVLANYIKIHVPQEGGIHPREAARHHSENMGKAIKTALDQAEITMKDVDIISFAQGPGLGPCLRTGATGARALAAYLKKPLVGVNHCVAHVEVGRMATDAVDPLTLYVSGGNTIVSGYESGRYRIFGETLDIAIGNCLDTFARAAGLEYPGGPEIERRARLGDKLIRLPYVVKGMDLSYSGLLTAITTELMTGKHDVNDLCFSLQETAYAMLGEITERALAHTNKPELLLTGGVAANKRLAGIVIDIAEDHDATPYIVPIRLAADNGAMIAWTGLIAYEAGHQTPLDESHVNPYWRMDQVKVPWRN